MIEQEIFTMLHRVFSQDETLKGVGLYTCVPPQATKPFIVYQPLEGGVQYLLFSLELFSDAHGSFEVMSLKEKILMCLKKPFPKEEGGFYSFKEKDTSFKAPSGRGEAYLTLLFLARKF